MPYYRVYLIQTVSTTVDVEADDQDQAVENALENAPPATNSSNHGINESGEWIEVSIEDETGKEVWSGYPQEEVARLHAEIADLHDQLAKLRDSAR